MSFNTKSSSANDHPSYSTQKSKHKPQQNSSKRSSNLVWRSLYLDGIGTYKGYVKKVVIGKKSSNRRRMYLPHGQGSSIDDTGNEYIGNWVRGVMHGKGKRLFKSGDIYEGEFLDGSRHGWGTYQFYTGDQYAGFWRHGKMHGTGTFIWNCGDIYQGDWRDGRMTGKGYKKMSTGEIVSGSWLNGLIHGYATKTFVGGDTYSGMYQNDLRHGTGTYTWAAGGKVIGNWLHGRIHGFATKYFQNGDIYRGEWNQGKLDGNGTRSYVNGDVYIGHFYHGKRQGHGIYQWNDGRSCYNGDWYEGRMHGEGYREWPNEHVSYHGQFQDGLATGYGEHTNKRLDDHYIGMHLASVRHGIGLYTWSNKMNLLVNWIGGRPHGIGVVQLPLHVIDIGPWIHGMRHGIFVLHYNMIELANVSTDIEQRNISTTPITTLGGDVLCMFKLLTSSKQRDILVRYEYGSVMGWKIACANDSSLIQDRLKYASEVMSVFRKCQRTTALQGKATILSKHKDVRLHNFSDYAFQEQFDWSAWENESLVSDATDSLPPVTAVTEDDLEFQPVNVLTDSPVLHSNTSPRSQNVLELTDWGATSTPAIDFAMTKIPCLHVYTQNFRPLHKYLIPCTPYMPPKQQITVLLSRKFSPENNVSQKQNSLDQDST